MGMIEAARDALKDIPISEVLRERLSLAVDRLEETEGKVSVLQTEKGSLSAQLERERLDHAQTKEELQRLAKTLQEEVRFAEGVEFRRGTRTGGEWLPFCPKCHLPISSLDISSQETQMPYCNDSACGWIASHHTTAAVIWRELGKTVIRR
jgi:hypothetical protein